jgi:hypothetical protein
LAHDPVEFGEKHGSPTSMGDEFTPSMLDAPDELSRRQFISIMGASLALGGIEGCTRQPPEEIVPYVQQPPLPAQDQSRMYATAHTLDGYANGVLVQSVEGRPVKVEGNPDHPISLGATNVFGQAAVLDVYDPDRSTAVLNNSAVSTWPNFVYGLQDSTRRDS